MASESSRQGPVGLSQRSEGAIHLMPTDVGTTPKLSARPGGRPSRGRASWPRPTAFSIAKHSRRRCPAHRRGSRRHSGHAVPALPVQGRSDLGVPRGSGPARPGPDRRAHRGPSRRSCRALTELATALTDDDFAPVRRGCPFINASAEFAAGHRVRVHAAQIRAWVTERLEDLLTELAHRDPTAAAHQLMMLRTGAVVSGALDSDDGLNQHFLQAWDRIIDDGLPQPR